MDAVNPQSQLQPVRDIELTEDRAQVGLDGSFGNLALGCDRQIGRTVGRERCYFNFSQGEPSAPILNWSNRRGLHAAYTAQHPLHEALADPHISGVNHFSNLFERGCVRECVAVGRATCIQGNHSFFVSGIGAGSDNADMITLQGR